VTVLVLGSVKASPGVTTLTLALALTWPRRASAGVRIVEADADGGTLAARLGLRGDPNLTSLAAAGRRGLEERTLQAHAHQVADGVTLLAAPGSGEQVSAAMSAVGPELGRVLVGSPTDTLVDAGRLSSRSPAIDLARAAPLTLLVATPRRDEVEAVAARAAALRDGGCAVGLICNRVRSATEAAEFAEVAEAELVGVIGSDDRTAAGMSGDAALSDRLLRRSSLLREAADLACAIIERTHPRAAEPQPLSIGGLE
jgi:MinD-like ATPase involved in chromosome partitioning or flagellar assembly